jgi:hypothetical protein
MIRSGGPISDVNKVKRDGGLRQHFKKEREMILSRRIRILVAIGIFATTGMVFASSTTFDGYTFVFSGSNANLYGMDKQIVHQWPGLKQNTGCADLLRDSSIIWPSSDRGSWTRGGALAGGRLQIIKWDGTVTWDFLYRSADYMPHHDIEPVYKTNDPKEKPNILVICYTAWGDKITELKPTGLNTADVVWEWYASDHTCEANTGTDKPELLDKGKGKSLMGGDFDIMHTNNVSYNRTMNQLVVSVNGYCELIVIDHSTTTAEAKGHTGGRWGKGGDILYRWGTPANYGMTGTKYFNRQHGCSWIQDTMPGTTLRLPGAFNMMAVDNGGKRVLEIVPAGTKNGVYPRTGGAAFEPASPLLTYSVSDLQGNEGSVQRLPNGNTLICTGGTGMGGGMGGTSCRVFEINTANPPQIVWELSDIPQSTEGIRYAYSYLNGNVGVTVDATPDYSTRRTARIVTNPLTGRISLSSNSDYVNARLSLFSMDGRELIHSGAPCTKGWDLGTQPNGQYLVQIQSGNDVMRERVAIQR